MGTPLSYEAGSVACAMCTPAKLISLAMHAPQPHIASQKCKQVACGLLQAGVAIALAPDGLLCAPLYYPLVGKSAQFAKADSKTAWEKIIPPHTIMH